MSILDVIWNKIWVWLGNQKGKGNLLSIGQKWSYCYRRLPLVWTCEGKVARIIIVQGKPCTVNRRTSAQALHFEAHMLTTGLKEPLRFWETDDSDPESFASTVHLTCIRMYPLVYMTICGCVEPRTSNLLIISLMSC